MGLGNMYNLGVKSLNDVGLLLLFVGNSLLHRPQHIDI